MERKYMKKSSKIMIFGGTTVALAVAAAGCQNDKDLVLDKEESIEGEVTSIVSEAMPEETTTTTKTFVTTTKSGEETAVPVVVSDNEVDVDYDTTIETSSDKIPDSLVNINDISGNNNDIDVNIIINAPVYSVSAEKVSIENGDQIIDSCDCGETTMTAKSTPVETVVPTTSKVTTAEITTTTTTKVETTKDTTPKTVATTEDTEPSEVVEIDDFKPVVVKLTAEDILIMSRDFADYLNRFDGFKHRNYKFDAFDMTDLYSVIYLTNIDYVDAKETKKLIEGGFISDNIYTNIENSFHFFSFYVTHSTNRIQDGRSDIIDISQIFVDKKGIKSYNTMYNMMTSYNSNKKSKNLKNYSDLVFYFAENTTIKNRKGYDYRTSAFSDDREVLAVGSDFTLCRVAGIIGEIAKVQGLAESEYIKIFDQGREDISDIIRVFEEYTNTKTKCKKN